MKEGTMKRKVLSILTALSLLTMACERNINPGGEGQIVLSSLFNYETSTTLGFSFDSEEFTAFTSTTPVGLQPDIIIETFKRVDAPPKPGFTSPSNDNGFALLGEFDDLAASEDFFNAYTEADSTRSLDPTTDTVRLYQVYLLQTKQDNFVKLLVRDIENFDNMSGEYIEVTIDYNYQGDGTPRFPG